jgi:hypothetical protein
MVLLLASTLWHVLRLQDQQAARRDCGFGRCRIRQGIIFINILGIAFCTKVFCTAFHYLQFSFLIFWQKNIGAKAAHKIYGKLT